MIQLAIGIAVTIAAIIIISVLSGKIAKKEKSANTLVVAGAIMGTLVGGSSTIGTAQLAYSYGMSAWWFTLGAGIACLILALVYVKPFYKSGNKTLSSFITNEYGQKCGTLSATFSALGSFINIISQLIASTAIIAVIFSEVPLSVSLVFSAVIMTLYIIFGGVKGSGVVGSFKMFLLYASMLVVAVLVIKLSGGLAGFFDTVNTIENPENVRFYSMFARGVSKDLGACLSLVLGVITTQSYAQAIFAAKSEKAALGGALIGAFLVPPIGIGGILVGLYMRAMHPGIVSKTALTYFVTEYTHPLFGGIILGALFIAVVGTGAGLALGTAIILKRDVLPQVIKKCKASEKWLIVLILALACTLSMGPFGDTILNFSYMSMALRGATLFVPLCFAIFCRRRVSPRFATVAIIAGPLVVLLFNLINVLPFDPLFAGVLASGIIMFIGFIKNDILKSK